MGGITNRQNRFQHCFCLLENVLIGKAQHLVTFFLQPFRALSVFTFLKSMNVPICFYDELFFHAAKINNVRANWMLAAKFVAAKLPMPEAIPEPFFRLGRFLTHFAGKMDQSRWGAVRCFLDLDMYVFPFGTILTFPAFSFYFTRLAPTVPKFFMRNGCIVPQNSQLRGLFGTIAALPIIGNE